MRHARPKRSLGHPPRIVYAGRVWRGTLEVPMPIPPKLPDNVQTVAYLDGDRLCVDVVVDHVVAQTVTLSLSQLREYRQLTAEQASRRPAVQLDPAALVADDDPRLAPSERPEWRSR